MREEQAQITRAEPGADHHGCELAPVGLGATPDLAVIAGAAVQLAGQPLPRNQHFHALRGHSPGRGDDAVLAARSATKTPDTCSFRMPMIWSSVNLMRFICGPCGSARDCLNWIRWTAQRQRANSCFNRRIPVSFSVSPETVFANLRLHAWSACLLTPSRAETSPTGPPVICATASRLYTSLKLPGPIIATLPQN